MLRMFRTFWQSAGKSPGSHIPHLPEREGKAARVLLYKIDGSGVIRNEIGIDRLPALENNRELYWIRVLGNPSREQLEQLGTHFALHRLTLEDIANPYHRPKLDRYEDYLLVIARAMLSHSMTEGSRSEQVSLLMGAGWVMSIEEEEISTFEGIEERLKLNYQRIHARGQGYLFYALLDAVIDTTFGTLDSLSSSLEELDRAMGKRLTVNRLEQLYALEKELVLTRRWLNPMRDITFRLYENEDTLINSETRIFMKDALDHSDQLVDAVNIFEQLVENIVSAHLSMNSHRSTQVMQTLTIIATIFIPLTFIVGIYGMNFAYMPELAWRPGYFVIWGIMLLLGGVMVVLFKRRGWF